MQINELKILTSGIYLKEEDKNGSLEELYAKYKHKITNKNVKKELEYVEKYNIKLIDFFSNDYPSSLKNMPYPPSVLYVDGQLKENELSLSVVGTRYPSGYGQRVVKYLIPYLVKSGFSIISGLAKGIDALAHKETIDNGGYTIAVLGCGIDITYPPENKNLFDYIKKQGCIISEFPIGTKPLKYNFPTRNRVIAALSKATLVVEADIKSGSLITARLAEEFSKTVFAVPGEIFSKRSKGTNKLINEGAIAVNDIDAILSHFYIEIKKEIEEIKKEKPNKEEQFILDALNGDTSIDELMIKTSMDISQLNDILFDLEMKGLIKRTPSDGYEKL